MESSLSFPSAFTRWLKRNWKEKFFSSSWSVEVNFIHITCGISMNVFATTWKKGDFSIHIAALIAYMKFSLYMLENNWIFKTSILFHSKFYQFQFFSSFYFSIKSFSYLQNLLDLNIFIYFLYECDLLLLYVPKAISTINFIFTSISIHFLYSFT
jgi:hypothetical protein